MEKVVEILQPDTTAFTSTDTEPEDLIDLPTVPKSTGAGKPIPPPPPPPPPVKIVCGDIFKVVEEMPVYGDCIELPFEERTSCSNQVLLNFIREHVKYPALARSASVEGTAVVRFVVEQDGSMTDLQLVRDPGAGTGEEALRVIQLLADQETGWSAGKQRGRPVRVQYHIPIRFALK